MKYPSDFWHVLNIQMCPQSIQVSSRFETRICIPRYGDVARARDCIKEINLSFRCPTCCSLVNAFLIPGGTPCIQMSCKQDIEGRTQAERGWDAKTGLAGEIKTNASTTGVTESRTGDTAEE